jgi:predicted RNase H-like HicB family nuclease
MASKSIRRFPVVIEEDEHGFFAFCPDLQGCYSQGKTLEKALKNIEDAIRLHVEDRLAIGEPVRAPQKISITFVEVAA